jgi:fibronectin-binding autotransporter adhesin
MVPPPDRPRTASPKPMKTRPSLLALAALTAPALSLTINKENNTTALNNTGSWVGGAIPGTGDTALWDATVTAANTTVSTGSGLFIQTLKFNNPGGDVVLNLGANTMTIGGGGPAIELDMSEATVDVTLNGGFYRLDQVTGTHTWNVAANRTLTVNSSISARGNSKTLELAGSGNVIINGAASGSGTSIIGLNVNGANVTLAGANKWNDNASSLFQIQSGTLNLANDLALDANTTTAFEIKGGTLTASGGSRVITTPGGFTLQGNANMAGTNNLTLASSFTNTGGDRVLTNNISGGAALTLSGTVNLSNDATNRTMTLGGSGDTFISGAIQNGGTATASNLTKTGDGTLTISGASNTFSGNTLVSAGTLLITGSLGSGAVIADGGTFGGTGTVAGDVTISNTASFAAGTSTGSIELGSNLTMGSAATTEIELGGTAFTLNGTEEYDRIKLGNAAGALDLGSSTIDITLVNAFTLAAGQAFGILQLEDGATRTGTFAGLLNDGDLVGNFGGHDLFITYSGNFGDSGTIVTTGGNDIVLYTMVPEPAAAALGAVGLLVLLRRRRKY